MTDRDTFERDRAEKLVHRLRKIVAAYNASPPPHQWDRLPIRCPLCQLTGNHMPDCEVLKAMSDSEFVFDATKKEPK